MSVFSHHEFDRHEHIAFHQDADAGLSAIIAIHNTNRGPAVGGCRMWPYGSDAEALTDALRLARGMTYKSALANLPFGGGKAVIIGDSRRHKTPELLRAMGRFVEALGGRYVIAEDVGTTVEDMDIIAETTSHVACTSDGSGDPSPYTAYGVYRGIRAAVQYKLKRNAGDLENVRVAVQGLGQVGYPLCRYMHQDGAELVVTDINAANVARAVDEFGAATVAADDIYDARVDVLAPCALGGVLNDRTVPRLRAKIVAGSANNQLAAPHNGDALAQRDILYAPDYVVNAGGIMEVAYGKTHGKDAISRQVDKIANTLMEIFIRADAAQTSTQAVADALAEERFLPTRGAA